MKICCVVFVILALGLSIAETGFCRVTSLLETGSDKPCPYTLGLDCLKQFLSMGFPTPNVFVMVKLASNWGSRRNRTIDGGSCDLKGNRWLWGRSREGL